ncbi:MAG: hypothetical protein U0350_28600 [Caldilineaceae bacterium]
MFAAHFFQHINDWFPVLSHLTQPAQTATAPAEQIIVQPGDTYFLAAGAYQLRVLTGHLWLPEHGLLAAGTQRNLRVDWRGLELRPAAAHPVVFTLSLQMERAF